MLKELRNDKYRSYLNKVLFFIVVLLLVFMPIIIVLVLCDVIAISEVHKKYQIITASFLTFGVAIAYIAYDNNLRWNKRKASITISRQLAENISEIKDKLCQEHKKFIKLKSINNTTLSVEEIHNMICEVNGDKKLLKKKNNHRVHKIDPENPHLKLMSAQGQKTRSVLFQLINNFEEIAIGIYYKIYDEKIVSIYAYEIIINNYILLKDYIKHLNERHEFNELGLFFVKLGEKWNNEKFKINRENTVKQVRIKLSSCKEL